MNGVCYRNMLLRLVVIALAITISITISSSMATADESPGVQSEPMAADSRPGPLGIAVSGSSAGVSADYFDQAVTDAVEGSGIFSSIADSEAAKISVRMLRVEGEFPSFEEAKKAPYFLHVRIIKVDTPSFSVRMTVGIDVIWTLYRSSDKTELMSERIESSYTGGFFEGGLHGGNRVRVAMEGAMRENARLGVEKLALMDFDVIQVDMSGTGDAGPES
jgi:hypothetical protein